jgi:hypothetical protein
LPSQLENYLAGIPLDEESAALLEGRDPALEIPAESAPAGESKANDEPLTDDDRVWLRRMLHEPGFGIFLRLLNSAILNREKGVTLLSSQDPLSNKERIVNEWAYIACFKTVMQDIQLMVQEQIKTIKV